MVSRRHLTNTDNKTSSAGNQVHVNQSPVVLAIDISIYQSTWNFCGLLEVIHEQLSTMMTLATKILVVPSNWLIFWSIYMRG